MRSVPLSLELIPLAKERAKNQKAVRNGSNSSQQIENQLIIKSGRQDSNLRPLRPERSALPGCATSRNIPVRPTGKTGRKDNQPLPPEQIDLPHFLYLLECPPQVVRQIRRQHTLLRPGRSRQITRQPMQIDP